MIHDIAKHLIKAHRFYPHMMYKEKIKQWRKSWLHAKVIKSSKPTLLEIAHAHMLDKALENKENFQKASEAIRFDFFDLWADMEYVQRNAFLIKNLQPFYEQACVFYDDEETILVPFFDPLLNALMMKRPAVFDLPQYFKLYKDFKESVIDPVSIYGIKLLASPFYTFSIVLSDHKNVIIYDTHHHAFLHLENGQLKDLYSMVQGSLDDALCLSLAHDIVNQDLVSFVEKGIEFQCFHPKIIRKCSKALKKLKKGQKV